MHWHIFHISVHGMVQEGCILSIICFHDNWNTFGLLRKWIHPCFHPRYRLIAPWPLSSVAVWTQRTSYCSWEKLVEHNLWIEPVVTFSATAKRLPCSWWYLEPGTETLCDFYVDVYRMPD
jgi:hypothetical protein